MTGKKSSRDPHRARERSKYGRAIPSREFILEQLQAAGQVLSHSDLAARLGVDEDWALEALGKRLRAMERDGQVLCDRRGRYGAADKMDLVRGTVSAHPDGYGFLLPDEDRDDLYLAPREMRQVLHGDRVMARLVRVDRRGRSEGAIVEVLERRQRRVVGRYCHEQGVSYLVPSDARITQDILISAAAGASHGQIAVAEITDAPTRKRPPLGVIVEVLGDALDRGMEVDIALRKHDIPVAWPPAVEDEMAALPAQVRASDVRGREDLTELPFITIDGEDARDFDDAVFAERAGRGWRLRVAIADVAQYVRPGSALDEHAAERGTSVYFPNRVVPMLPEALSNGLCSLVADEQRLVLVCDMRIGPRGEIRSYRFCKGVIRSHARTTYTEIAGVPGGDRKLRRRYEALTGPIDELGRLYQAFAAARVARGTMEFDTVEARLLFDDAGQVCDIVPVQRNDAHRLIEECMIAANRCAAEYLTERKLPALYRVHAPPAGDRVEALRAFLAELGLVLHGGLEPEPADYLRVLDQAQGRADLPVIQTVILRSLKQAVYQPGNDGHFGLALEAYAHFTSPIRRYPDLLVHRAIRHALRGRSANSYTYGEPDMARFGERCSSTERRAEEASREVVAGLKCAWLEDRVGDTFDGVVSGVTSFGLFVTLNGIYTEGLVHITALGNDYYHFDPVHHRLSGERTRQVFRLGDALRVQVTRVDLDERKIDLVPV